MKPALIFDIKKTVQYWLESAEYDLSVADAMFEKGKYPYALFMAIWHWKNFSKRSLLKQPATMRRIPIPFRCWPKRPA